VVQKENKNGLNKESLGGMFLGSLIIGFMLTLLNFAIRDAELPIFISNVMLIVIWVSILPVFAGLICGAILIISGENPFKIVKNIIVGSYNKDVNKYGINKGGKNDI